MGEFNESGIQRNGLGWDLLGHQAGRIALRREDYGQNPGEEEDPAEEKQENLIFQKPTDQSPPQRT